METATFGAGCFWGVESFFREVPGVIDAVSGYAGGQAANPSYRQVCTGMTNHAEVVEVTFDPSKVSFEKLVDLFFKMHDPSQLNGQGPDVGTQYRSVVFAHSPQQVQSAKAKIAELTASGRFGRAIATTVEDAPAFWRAEEYHQRYFEKNNMPSCHMSYEELKHQ